MLINKDGYTQDEIVGIKLVSGQEVLGKFASMDDNTIVMTHVMEIGFGPQGLGMSQYMISAELADELSIMLSNVIIHNKAPDDLADIFTAKVTPSLIKTVQKPEIIMP